MVPIIVLVIVVSGFLCSIFLIRRTLWVVTVSGSSMDPTLVDGDRVLMVRGWPAWWRRRGQIVVLTPWAAPETGPPPPAETLYIKRVIGLPGDTLVTRLDELHADLQTALRTHHDAAGQRRWHIPPGHCFVRGDYPRRGADSLGWGPAPSERVRGWVLLRLERAALPAPAAAGRQDQLDPGQVAPPFTADTLDGRPVNRATYAGRTIVLLFVTANPKFRPLIAEYAALQDRAAQAGVELLLVWTNSTASAQILATEVPTTLPILVAPRTANPFVQDYKILTLPRYCLIGRDGMVQAVGYPSHAGGAWQGLVDSWA